PVPELITMPKHQFYANGSVCYAEGWAFCQFLLHSGDKKLARVIPNYIKYVKNDTNYEAVTERVFKGIDLEELDTRFKAWIEELPTPGADDEDDAKGER
ncbi:MAG: hypothetical protein KAI24_01525, partial [Planctomycetes bacterium]|nr:hypothetical protein [Planctomycetota bacterium]